MKDRELTRLLQTHPEEGLEAAMLAYAPLVKAVLNRILPQNPCDREECMADVFVSLWRNAAKLDHTATPLRPWLIVTARNKGIDRYNALRRREVLSLDDGLTETLGELAEFDRATADAADLVGALVAAMEPPDRDIFLRKYYLLQSGKEIAAALSRCGLTVTVDSVPWETYLQRLQDGSFDLYYGECRLTADWDILELVGTEGSLNYGGFSDEDTDVLLAACRTASEGQRSKALTALWQDLLEKMPIAPLCFKSDSVLTTTGLVEGLTATETDPFFSLEQWTVHLDTPQAAK